MNDAELDRLLDAWEAPAPPRSLRGGLSARFPRAERRRFARPLLWVLASAVASVTLAIGMEQCSENPRDFRLVRGLNQICDTFNQLYDSLLEGLEATRAASVVAQIRQSEPKVYVDGRFVAPLEYGHATGMNVEVPGEGVYSIILFRGRLTDWVEAGHIHGNMIEFQAGSRHVRIECNKTIVDSDRPVFVRRLP